MMKDMVSVVIPMYNSEKYICDTVKSVLNQTYYNIEVIIVDDGSTDASASIVKKIIRDCSDKKVKYYYQNNSGVSSARNRGIEESSGKYIAFIDSDDLWINTKIESQMELIYRTSMKACYCGFSDFFEKDNTIKKRKMKFSYGRILYDFLKDNVWCFTSTWIIEKSLIEDNNIRFTENCNWGEDFEFFMEIAALTEVCCAEKYLALYRIRSNSLTTASSFLKQSDDIYVWIQLNNWMKENYNRLIYKDVEIISDLIYGFRIPFSLINYTYAFFKNSSDKEIYENADLINGKIKNNKYIKKLKFNNGLKSVKLYIKLFLMNFRMYKIKLCNSLR